MNQPTTDVSICIVPRERFSCAVDSLNNVISNTAGKYKLVYVDANSPPVIAAQLAAICREHDFTYIREERYMSPNEARNVGLNAIDTTFVACIDNDLFVSPGWLGALLDCARATGAWAVGPVVLEGSEKLSIIHMAGGDLIEDRVDGFNRIRQRHREMFKTLGSVKNELVREPVGSFEFHCVLLRANVFPERRFLDEGLLSHQEHLDVAREIRLAGGEVYFEPKSIVRYDNARKFEDYDREFFELRWGEDWSNRSIEHTRKKWNLGPDDGTLKHLANWTNKHRKLFEKSQTPWALHVAPVVARKKLATWLRKHKVIPKRELH